MAPRTRAWRAALAAVLAAAWLVAGPAPGAAAAGPTRTVTDSLGRSVEVPVRIERVLAAGPPAAVLLYTLAPEKLIGWTAPLAPAARAMLPAQYAALPVVGRVTSAKGAPDAAAIAALHPDLIVDAGNLDPRYAALAERVQAETGIPYLLYDGSLAHTAATYRALGGVLGVEARAEDLARYAEGALAALRQPPISGHAPVRVYYARSKGGTATAARGAITAEILDAVGAENVAAEAGNGTGAPVSVEEVRAWRPAAVLAFDPKVYAAIMRDPQWQQLEAVRAGHVYLAPGAPFSWIDEPPGVNRLIGLPWLAGVLATGAPPADMAATARAFYARFYHVELGAAELDELLAPPRLK